MTHQWGRPFSEVADRRVALSSSERRHSAKPRCVDCARQCKRAVCRRITWRCKLEGQSRTRRRGCAGAAPVTRERPFQDNDIDLRAGILYGRAPHMHRCLRDTLGRERILHCRVRLAHRMRSLEGGVVEPAHTGCLRVHLARAAPRKPHGEAGQHDKTEASSLCRRDSLRISGFASHETRHGVRWFVGKAMGPAQARGCPPPGSELGSGVHFGGGRHAPGQSRR
jgi:hypothetical protein